MREVHTSIKHIHEQHAFSITDAMALLLVYRVMQGRLYIILCMSIIIYIIRGYILYEVYKNIPRAAHCRVHIR